MLAFKGNSEHEQLLIRCRRQDSQAWSELVDKFQALVYSVASRHGLSREDSEDVLVATFQNLLRSIDRIESGSALPKWLAVTASRECLRTLRFARRSPELDSPELDLDQLIADEESRTEESALAADQAFRLRQHLAKIPSRCRDLLQLLYFEDDMSYTSIGKTIGIPVGAIGPTRARCLEKLRSVLESEGFFSL